MRKIFCCSLVIFIIIVVISLVIIIDNKINIKDSKIDPKDEKLLLLNNIDKKIDYFNYQYLDRYVNYKNNNPNLSDSDIITQVNIGLDQPYYQNTREAKLLNKNTILVNKYNFLPDDYIPNNLTEISKECSSSTKLLVYEAKENFEKMCIDAKKDNYNIRAVSSYRSYDYQKQLYDNYVKKDGMEKADTYSARPGYSEHQTGLVVDIDNVASDYNNFSNTNEYLWMQEHAHEYGFILRYPNNKQNITGYNYESWHYRYVGKDIASYIKNNNLTYDEYYVKYINKKI